ncbi:hemagglutinin repeat-containing protein [Achromobacter sp. Root83]|uniref:hemagglutinin repeat-containing protein n=1 Tax=Achromobacter sp. Root83 TaxID=1736602 RepID=UPI00138EFBBD|nr:hemagglutinin repeat-containing protein [Achromobacter sp. Root83]
MSKLRSLIVWSVVFTQLWTPVLAQTLPISVDKSVPGQKPTVGVSNGVPVINIAPPSAGGVSNNRYTQFNVGPSGVVLNNSGGASQTQLAGQVAGNVMLGNQRAATILNQVTAPNPSQLMGMLEVAGNRANVIVANPAGITCNGCGFLNAGRATLTTGRPQVGPDGSIALDVAAGKIRVEGEGLYGANVSQVDLIARSLEINAGVWADRLTMTAGAARVDYATGAVSAQAGDGAAPAVALDTAALGGMYANSIRLIGTEAGVGVNVGGDLVALTGDLQVSAAGDVRIAPSATMQAARDLRLTAGRDLAVDGAAQAAGAVALAAGRNAEIKGAVGAGGPLDVDAAGDATVAAQGALQAQGALRIAAGQDLLLGGSLLMGGQDVRVESGRNVRIGGNASTPGTTPPATGGSGSAAGGTSSGGAGSGSASGAGGSSTDGTASAASGGAGQAGADSSGLVTARGGIALRAGRDMTLPAQVTAAGALHAQAGADLTTGATAQLQSGGPATIRAGADLRVGGLVGARGDVSLMAGRDALVSGKGAATGRLAMDAGGDLRLEAPAQWDAEGAAAAKAGGDMALAGVLRANGDTVITAGGKLAIDGAVSAASGGMNASAGGDVSVGAQAQVAAAGPVGLNAGGNLQSFGKVTSLKDLSLQAARNLALDGETLATGDLRLQAGEVLAASSASRLQADGSVMAAAGNASLAGLLIAGQSAQVNTRDGLRVDGTLLADAGTLKAISGGDVTLGSASVLQAGRQLDAQAGGKLLADGTISGETDIRVSAGTNAELNGKTVANGALRAEAGADLTIGQAGLAQGSGMLFLGAGQDLRVAGTAGTADMGQGGDGFLQAQAARDIFVTGIVTAGTPASLSATRNLGIDGTVTALGGGLTADAGDQLRVGATGRMQAAQNLIARSGGDLDSDGVLVAGGGLALTATGDARLGGTAAALGDAAAGNLLLGARDVTVKQGGQLQAAGTLTAQAQRDLVAAGRLASVEDMMLAAARDARVDGTAASDTNLSLTGRNVAVGAAGLAQAAGTLTATAQGTLLAVGSMLAGVTQTLTAGDDMTVDGTVAALQGDLTLETLRGNLVLGTASNQQAGGMLAATAGGALQALGSAAAGQGLTLRAGTDATLGGIAAARAGNVTATANRNLTTTADGRIQAADAIDLESGGALQNAGILSAAGAATLLARTSLNNSGSVLAGGDVNATALGALTNAGRFIAGVDEDGALSLPGSVKLTAAFITHPGISAAGKDMTLFADGMDLSAGNLSSIGKLALTSPGDIATRNAVLHGGTLDIAAANLRNQGGKLTSAGDAVLTLGAELDNTTGLIAAAGNMQIEAARVGNAAGTLAGGDLTLAAAGAVDNRGGLIQADETLTLNAAGLDNSATLTAAAAPPKGVLGKLVTIVADRVNNQGGSISAGQDLAITTGELDNAGGEVAAQRYATVDAALLKNSQGKVMAGERLAIMIQALQGLGALQSAQDLSFTYTGSLNQTGDIAAGRDLSMSVGGAMDNSATVSAGRDLTISAASLNNQASGELLAGRNNTINVTNGLTNSGLIDGGATNINARRVDNFGRIYGNTISIRAGELVNGAGPGGGAVIAARGDLDLGVGSLVNRDHALIYAGADLRIGGMLDANRKAIGQAVSLLNASATVEAAGNAAISAASLQNVNTNFVSQTLPVLTVPKLYVTPAGSTDMYDMETNWFCDQVTPMCGKVPEWLNDDPERRFLLPSDRYPASRFGPPFDYVPNIKGRAGQTAPIPVTYFAQMESCGGDAGNCMVTPERFVYANDAPIWAVFGVTPPSGPLPVWQPLQQDCFGPEACAAEAARRQAYEDAYTAFKAQHLELDQRIREFNADFDNRLVGTFTYYQVDETVTETRTVSSDPAKILSGGSMTLTGTVTNDKSQIAAGGTLSVAGPAINNIGAGGERIITRIGTLTVTQARDRDRKDTTSAYTQTLAAESIELPVGTSGGNVSVSLSGGAPGASGATAPGPVLIASIGLPGGNVVRTVSNPATIPDSQLFAVNGTPDAPYVVATDPRFVGNRPTVSSDYLFDLLQQPGAPVGNSGASGSVNAGLGNRLGGLNALIPAGAKFLTPSGQPRRLGDGFYEQKLVADQILATSGQRFLEGFGDNDSQYKALLANGAQFALDNGIKLGAALTEAQQRQLTTDLVWLVEQTVTLPDGSTETVLVPQVYLLVREGDLKGDGTLMAGRDVKLAADGDIVNSGTIGSRDATVMTAANIINQAGGLIQGAVVDLAAREDLTNLVSLIKGDYVALSAGRDIALTSTAATENNGATWGSYVSGVSRVDAGNLSMQAGRDLNLTAAQVTVKDDARLQAGRDINLATLEESHGESLARNKKNRHDLSTSTEIGSVIAAGGNLTLIAGQDVNARAADVTAGKQLAVGAGRDINLTAGVETGSAYDETHYKTSGFMSSKTTHTITSSDWATAKGSNFTGDTVALMAGRDLTVQGSNVIGDNDVLLMANRDITIAAAAESYKDYQYEKVTRSGLGGGGGFNIGYSKQARTDWMKGESGGYSSSTVGSVGGNVTIDAGRDVGVFASNVLAQDGDISIAGRNVAIVAGVGEARQHEYHELKQSGITIGVAGGVLGAAQQIHGTLKQAGEAKSGRLAAVKVGQAAYQAVQANRMMDAAKGSEATTAQKEAASAQIQISMGASKSVSETKRTQETAFGSSVMAGGNVSIVALGERGVAGSGNLSIIGSDVSGKNVLLAATNDLFLLSQAQTATEVSTNKNSGWKVGVGIGVSDSGSGGGINIFASGYAGKGNANGNGTTYRETQVSAQDNLTLISGRDTVLMGAQARADSIRADIGRNLTIASQQDTDRYNAKQSQINAGGSFSFGSMSGSAYIGASTGKTKSNYDSVAEQSGLYAGTGGFDIYVGKHTQLDGGVIASDAAAAKNKLSTETFGYTDLQNKAEYKSTTVGVNLGMSGAFDVANKGGANAIGPSGLSFAQTSGSDSGTTYAAIAPGTIEVRSDKDTGRDSTAGLSRDTAGANGSIGQIFDKDKVREQLEFQQAFGQLGMQIAGDVLKDLKKDNPDLWGEGKAGAIAMHAAIAGIGAALGGGNVAGAIGGTIAGDLASNLVQDQIAQAVAGLPEGMRDQVSKVITNVVASAAGGAVGGLSGAGGASLADMYNKQLHEDDYKYAKSNAKDIAKRLGITEEAAEARILAALLQGMDQDASGQAAGKVDWELRGLMGCGDLKCFSGSKDPDYANSSVNTEYILSNWDAYSRAREFLGQGQTYNERVAANVKNDPVGTALLGGMSMAYGVALTGSIPTWNVLVTGGIIGGSVNAGSQYVVNGQVNWSDTGMAGVTGALTGGTKLWPGVLINAGGALVGSSIKGENPNGGMAGAALGTLVGFGIGTKIENGLANIYNPWYRADWIDMGMGLSRFSSPSNIPWISGAGLGAFGSETTNSVVNILLNNWAQSGR